MKKISAFVLAILMIMLALASSTAEGGFLIVTPNGAPAIAVAGVYAEQPESVQTIGAGEIANFFGSGEADFMIAPINAGARLYKMGKSTYRLAAVVTWGNLVFASRLEGFTPEMINGRKLVLFGENTLNASIALYTLENMGIKAGEIEYQAEAADTIALLMNDEEADTIVMTAEPAVTSARIKNPDIQAVPLNQLYKEVSGFDGFPQAGLFVSGKAAEERPDAVLKGIEMIRASVDLCGTDPEKTADTVVAMEVIKNKAVVLSALPGCNIRYMSAKDAKEQIEKSAAVDLKQFGGDLPADDFYYDAE